MARGGVVRSCCGAQARRPQLLCNEEALCTECVQGGSMESCSAHAPLMLLKRESNTLCCVSGLLRVCVVQVLGLAMPKNKKISTSNWEHVILSRSQLKYAALDVLMAGQVFRALRLWHSSPSLCEVCHYNLGTACSNVFQCQECDKTYWDIKPYVHHCERYRHKQQWAECEGCGCARELPWPATKAAEQQAADQHPSSQQSS